MKTLQDNEDNQGNNSGVLCNCVLEDLKAEGNSYVLAYVLTYIFSVSFHTGLRDSFIVFVFFLWLSPVSGISLIWIKCGFYHSYSFLKAFLYLDIWVTEAIGVHWYQIACLYHCKGRSFHPIL